MNITGYNLENSLMIYTSRCMEIHHRVQEAKESIEEEIFVEDEILVEETSKCGWGIFECLWGGSVFRTVEIISFNDKSDFDVIARDFNELAYSVSDLVCHDVDEDDYLAEICIIEKALPPLKFEVKKIKQELDGIDDRGAQRIREIADSILKMDVSIVK